MDPLELWGCEVQDRFRTVDVNEDPEGCLNDESVQFVEF